MQLSNAESELARANEQLLQRAVSKAQLSSMARDLAAAKEKTSRQEAFICRTRKMSAAQVRDALKSSLAAAAVASVGGEGEQN